MSGYSIREIISSLIIEYNIEELDIEEVESSLIITYCGHLMKRSRTIHKLWLDHFIMEKRGGTLQIFPSTGIKK